MMCNSSTIQLSLGWPSVLILILAAHQ